MESVKLTRSALVTYVSLALVMVLGAMVAINAMAGLLAVTVMIVIGIVASSARARLIAVVVGALLVFQSEAGAGKIAYLGLASLCFALSATKLMTSSDRVLSCFRPMLI